MDYDKKLKKLAPQGESARRPKAKDVRLSRRRKPLQPYPLLG
jgi:hypothetical protein